MFKLAIPVLHVSSSVAAEEFYCRQLGFRLEFANRPNAGDADPCYMGLIRDGVPIHVSSFSGDGVAGQPANIYVDDLDALHAELIAAGVRIDPGHPVTQTWGTREMYVRDPDGNCLRFIGD